MTDVLGHAASGRYVIVQMDNGEDPMNLDEVKAFGRFTPQGGITKLSIIINSKCPDVNFIFSGCIEEDGIVYWGQNIPGGMKTTANAQECADFSATIPGGLFWTFNKNSKTCSVKSSNFGRRTVGHAVSGSRKCGKKIYLSLFQGLHRTILGHTTHVLHLVHPP